MRIFAEFTILFIIIFAMIFTLALLSDHETVLKVIQTFSRWEFSK